MFACLSNTNASGHFLDAAMLTINMMEMICGKCHTNALVAFACVALIKILFFLGCGEIFPLFRHDSVGVTS